MCKIHDILGPLQPIAGISRADKNDKLALFRVVRSPTLLAKRPRDEAWRRLSQILKNVIASDADATVKLYLLFPVSRTYRLMPPHISI
jgi:hypothetical protein